ncbi:hypothetical protein WG947_07975 [Pontibacter sp. H259]|uniref:hypothetical protein n=1 Tax=Pontibacter sp. H259 TaxID=3133421 RepID=UPI0030BA7E92
MHLDKILISCEENLKKINYHSFDPYDALTNKNIDTLTQSKPLLRRIAIQMISKSPLDLHFLGMSKMVHTKTVSDLLWYHSIKGDDDSLSKVDFFFEWLLNLRIQDNEFYSWGLNFPYTSRFIDADKNMPNLYNTINAGLAICYSFDKLKSENQILAKKVVKGIIEFIETSLNYTDEGSKGWYSYYPNQTSPTYNVNALALYFLVFVQTKFNDIKFDDNRIDGLINLLCDEQQDDGSWFYSRSKNGAWIDGFHTGFILESLAFAFKELKGNKKLLASIEKGWLFYINEMFTSDGFPRYLLGKGKYPIDSQNCAQAIQTISNVGQWINKNEKELLTKVIQNSIDNLYSKEGFFYYKKSLLFTYRSSYIRWSTTPMMLALKYAQNIY